jgi:Flp pilus assembly protein TadD
MLPLALLLATGMLGACSSQPQYPVTSMAAAPEDAVQKQPDQQPIYVELIQKMVDTGQYYAALAYLDQYDRRWPATHQTQFLRATAYRNTGRLPQAATIYAELTHTGLKAKAYEGLGLVKAAQGHMPQALSDFKAAVEYDPTDVNALNNLGYSALALRDYPLAEETLFKAGQLAPQDKKIWSNIAVLMALTNQQFKAETIMARFQLSWPERKAIYHTVKAISSGHAPSGAADHLVSTTVMPGEPGAGDAADAASMTSAGNVTLLQPRITGLFSDGAPASAAAP